MDDLNVTQAENTQTTDALAMPEAKQQRTVQDWIRDMRMSSDVNKTTVGVDTDRVTPDLLLATSSKLLGIARREREQDSKDSMQFQRVYGPVEYFSEHVLRDSGKLGRNLLWKATNRGNLDFMQTGALDKHISDVFYDSKLANMVDGSSPLELMDGSMKITRIGEGGVGDADSAPVEMRLVQPSFYGFVDPVRSVDGFRIGLDAYLAKNVLKGSDGKLYRRMVNARTGKEELVDSVTAAKSVVTTPEMMKSDTSSIYALGGKTGVRIVKKSDVDYYMPRSDEMFSTSANLVPMLNGVKEMRLHMGCLHPMTTLLTMDASGLLHMTRAKATGNKCFIEGTRDCENEELLPVANTVSKFPPNRNWFRKVVLLSGRTVVTSADHKWSVLRDGKWELVPADGLKPGDTVPRSLHSRLPSRKTYMCGTFIDADMAYLLGHAVRTLRMVGESKLRIEFPKDASERIETAVGRMKQSESCSVYSTAGLWCLSVNPGALYDWLLANVSLDEAERQVPSAILSAGAVQASAFIDGYTSDSSRVAMDGEQNVWLLNIANDILRDGLAVVLSRIGEDTLYRDAEGNLALELIEMDRDCGDFAADIVKSVSQEPSAPIMVDVDVDDNLFATASGIVTHNSKYALQSIPLDNPEPQLVRTLDEASGKDMPSLIGKYLGAQYARRPGHVAAVRKDRIDVVYDDGTKGQVPLYVDFPMNAKGFISNKPQVKAGQSFAKGDLLASSNWTDDKGVAAIGKPLRCAWISWKGGTYEDGITISESCAEKLRSTTMYPTSVDLDKTVKLGKANYQTWKPGTFTKTQLEALDNDGVVKPGTVLRNGDPMILAVQTAEPSPGTLGKRLLTDMSETWTHDHPGIVTDVVKTRNGVKVLAKVSAPCEVGDKLSNSYGAKGTISQILPDDQMPQDKDGNAMDLLFSPLGLITRTNASQLHETLLGKIAHKTGKPEIMPEFYDGDLTGYVNNRLKQHYLTAEDDLVNPETGKPLKGILNGYSYIYKLKHLAESKMAGRGTAAYTSEGLPSGGGYEGCFPARQEIMTLQGKQSIAEICERRQPVYVLTWDGGTWCYKQVTDWFTYRADVENILHIRTEFNLSDTGSGRMLRHHTSLYPTKNHKMYMADMSVKLAGELKPGDMLAGIGPVPTKDQISVIYGTMLGDSYIDLNGNLVCEHSIKQDCYYTWKYELLKSLGARLSSEYAVKGRTILGHVCKRSSAKVLTVPRSAALADIETAMVDGRERRITAEALDSLGELGVSLWVLDDGSIKSKYNKKHEYRPEAVLSTQGFRGSDVKLAAEWFDKFLGTNNGVSLRHVCRSDGTESYALYFTRAAAQKLSDIIARNVPYTAIPQSKFALRRYCMERQEGSPVVEHDTSAKMGVMPVRIISIDQYTHDKPGVVNIPVYDFTVDETHRYVLSGGVLVSNSKRYGSLEQSAMVSHMAFNAIQDAKQIRGQSNADFWRSIRTGGIPTMPGESMVQRKFFAHLQGAGVNVRKTRQGVSVFALTNSDVEELAGPRELKSKDTYEAKNFRPLDGGLFGQDIFGINGDKWGYIQLDEPVPNPVMEEPLARMLRITQSDFEAVASGTKTVDGMSSAADIAKRLQGMDLEAEAAKAKKEFKDSTKSRRDAALKRYKAIELMRRQGVRPEEYMLTKIPVLPPDYRPVSTHSGLTMVADSNYLYAQLLDARNDLRDARELPEEYQAEARANLYRKWKELAGLYDPENPKLQSKNVKGLLAWALGNGSPKFSGFNRKVLGSTVDTVGRGVVVANPRVKLNEIGMPEKMAFDVYAPFVERELVKSGYTPVDAMKLTKAHDQKARSILLKVMQTHPVQMNRAPTLHKLSIMGFNPVLVPGHAIHVNPSIVSPFAMDFDGDTIHGEWLVQVDRDELSRNLEKLKIAEKSCLTNANGMLYYDCDGQSVRCETIIEKENNMLTKDAKARFSSAVCSPAELPVVEESKQVRGNVTEWDVVPGIYTDTIDLAGNRVMAPVTKVSRHENLKMFDVALSAMGLYPHIVTASEDHSLITFNANTFEYEKTRPEDAVGKLVPRVRKDATVSAEHCHRTIMLDKPYELSHDFGIILGMILGDGWVTEDGQCIVAACDESVQKELLRLSDIRDTVLPVLNETKVASYAADPARFSQADMQRIDLHVKYAFGKALREKIGHGAWNKRIPAECLRGSHAHLTGLLVGLLATDGTVSFADNTTAKKFKSKTVQVHTTSPELRDCIQELCSRIGIRTSVTAYMGEHSVHTCYAVSLSIVDLAKEYRRHPVMLHIPHDAKAAALERIVDDVESAESARRYPDIVPMPTNMAAEFSWAKVCNAGCMSRFKEQGYLARPKALEMAKELKKLDWSAYVECKALPMSQKTGHTPEQAKELVDRWIAMVEDERISWEHVDSVTPSTCTEGWDCTVPGPYTFTLSSGTVVQDTVNLHVPVSDQAREDTYNRMFPERNLIAMRDRKIAYKPEKEYIQGTYLATRMKKGERTRIFDSLEEARKAYRDGQLDVDDPIIIRDNKN